MSEETVGQASAPVPEEQREQSQEPGLAVGAVVEQADAVASEPMVAPVDASGDPGESGVVAGEVEVPATPESDVAPGSEAASEPVAAPVADPIPAEDSTAPDSTVTPESDTTPVDAPGAEAAPVEGSEAQAATTPEGEVAVESDATVVDAAAVEAAPVKDSTAPDGTIVPESVEGSEAQAATTPKGDVAVESEATVVDASAAEAAPVKDSTAPDSTMVPESVEGSEAQAATPEGEAAVESEATVVDASAAEAAPVEDSEARPSDAPEQTDGLGEEEQQTVVAEIVNPDEFVAEAAGASDTDRAEMRAVIEAVIYITEEPLTAQQIASALDRPLDVIKQVLAELTEEYARPDRGLTIREIAGGYKLATKPEHHEAVRAFVKNLKPPLKLSLAALETLAVIAYKQPVTGPEIMEIRGVQGLGVLKTLIDRKLIATAGRKNVVGKPILYKTTKEFLVQFGLKDLAELPTLKEFEELGRLAMSEDPEPAAAPAASNEKPAQVTEEPAKEEHATEAATPEEAAPPGEVGSPAEAAPPTEAVVEEGTAEKPTE